MCLNEHSAGHNAQILQSLHSTSVGGLNIRCGPVFFLCLSRKLFDVPLDSLHEPNPMQVASPCGLYKQSTAFSVDERVWDDRICRIRSLPLHVLLTINWLQSQSWFGPHRGEFGPWRLRFQECSVFAFCLGHNGCVSCGLVGC